VALATPLSGPILGIESSCDDTAVAVLDADGRIIAESVARQIDHEAFGGVVPEIAARAHLALLPALVARTMAEAGLQFSDLSAIAATTGPGLIGGLIVGSGYGKGVAIAHNKPFLAINHLEAHALTARLPSLGLGAEFPYLLLLVSGGHCQCIAVAGVGQHTRLGGTIDDAAGEAFDKVAKLLGLGWPGGPALEALATEGNLAGRAGCDFSFSGLKTAVATVIATFPHGALPRQAAADIAASFQQAVADTIADRAGHAMAMFRALYPTGNLLVVAGGVAANATLRATLLATCNKAHFRFAAPPLKYCADNATMVAWAGLERLRAGAQGDDLDVAPRPRWPLAELTP